MMLRSGIASRGATLATLCLLLVAAAGAAPAHGADLEPWELSTFDAGAGYTTGGLGGQQGWEAVQKSPKVVACAANSDAGCGATKEEPQRGQVLSLNPDPGSGKTIVVKKTVAPQTAGLQLVELDVMATGVTDPSTAKLEVQTDLNNGWDKKFQIYFGTTMRVNYDASGSQQVIVAATEDGHWYHLRCELDLATNLLNVWVDDVLATPAAIPMHTGPVVSVSFSGWEFQDGHVFVDDLVGLRQLARIASPARGATVSGTRTVSVTAGAGTRGVEFYVDGARQAVDTTAPFSFSWNTARNPFPAPTHGGFPGAPFGFGYWLAQWKGQQVTTDGCCLPEVEGYTNLYHARSRMQYEIQAGETLGEWLPRMEAALDEAFFAGEQLLVNLEIPYTCTGDQQSNTTWCEEIESVLDTVEPYINQVVAFELADEPAWAADPLLVNAAVGALEQSLVQRGLAGRSIGLVYAHSELPSSVVLADTDLDFVSIEAYLNGPATSSPYEYSPLSNVNQQLLKDNLRRERDTAVAAGKSVVYIVQAYTRNFHWAAIDRVREIQPIAYLAAASDAAVRAIEMFSYLRASGSRDFPDLQVPHRLMGERIGGVPLDPPAGNGARTLSIRAVDASGATSWDFLPIQVGN